VLAWRLLKEEKLRSRTGLGMNADAVARFVMHFERLTRHMLASMPDQADIVVRLDDRHELATLHFAPDGNRR
jgi:D-glycerate 3-kinase